ncbi:hypothetical protein C1H46_044413 [Malus baccata]|uniref:Uncharacterized protein n=1 Tax=Malus baccata TaxID=106549 RepID=A0A540K750_MALBA|nr:hypothetical protein C1H46_044413 [Malus baccata]
MATHVFMPQELFPQKLQVCIEINGLDKVVHNKLESGISNDSVHVQPIKLEEIYVESYNKAKIYKGKKRQLNSSLILCQDILAYTDILGIKYKTKVSSRETKASMEGTLFNHKDSFT